LGSARIECAFFPTFDPVTGTLASLCTYAVGFLGRPLGAALFGHFGDRTGRKKMLMVTMTVMALGTFAIGLLRPVYEALFKNTANFFVAVGLKLSEVSWVYILSVFIVFYATVKLGMPKATLLNAIVLASLIEIFTIPLFGWFSDKIGRRFFYFSGVLFTICFAFPLFWLIDTNDPFTVTIAIVAALNFGHGTMFGLQSTFFPELFGTRVRYTGASFGFSGRCSAGRRSFPGVSHLPSGSDRRHRGCVSSFDRDRFHDSNCDTVRPRDRA
jgi:MFS family permease